MFRRLAAAAIVFLPMTGLASAGATLDVKPGLWEMTTTQKMSGMPQMPALSQDMLDQMTDEQKAQMDAAMKMAAGEETTTTMQQCVTQADLDDGALMKDQDPSCKQEIIEQSPNRIEVKTTCEPSTGMGEGHMVFEAQNNETMTGQFELAGGEGGMSMTMSIAGKWLGADCGDVE
jgi:hypothetical protein